MKKRILSAVFAAVLMTAAFPVNAFADGEPVQHTVTGIDFDGNVMTTFQVNDGESVDLSGIDVSVLSKHLDIYTEIAFNAWSDYPDEIYSDITIKALSKKMSLSLDNMPDRTEYYSKTGDIFLDGLKVTITVLTQIPQSFGSGSYITTKEVLGVESKCYTQPATLDEAFADGDTAEIDIIPLGEDKPIATYEISYFDGLGDSDLNGAVDSSDASFILKSYAAVSTGDTVNYEEGQKNRCDVDRNGQIDSSDATLCLRYYAVASTGELPNWEELIFKNTK